jgi:hypothetical protein
LSGNPGASASSLLVIPAQAGIQLAKGQNLDSRQEHAGMTVDYMHG